ncbi:hypothetical protein AK88_05668 [Plasmodium fragile]|uniref:Uncharacterized protein n=1 Tax=Plasmodium fragile TaxID=5857 RepID=A0A0D9QCD3_PLAFR|nr:uncharacterized protein AK88_05668 [Plasmodium fragile]KJP84700.1 hypothetical protein AK88_05668 [Plasmodium fragile]
MSARKLGELLVEYVRRRGVHMDDEQYQNFLENDVVSLLEQFMKALMDENLDEYATYCNNAFWEHPSDDGDKHQPQREMKEIGQRARCRLMTGALYFLNGWVLPLPGSERIFQHDPALKKYIACAIVNVFTYILDESTCGTKWGTYYAWYTMKNNMEGLDGNEVEAGTCQKGVFEDIKRGQWSMSTKIDVWLKKEKKTLEQIGAGDITDRCKKDVREKNPMSTKGAREHANNTREVIEKQIEDRLKQGLKGIVSEVKEGVKDRVREIWGAGGYSANPEDDNDDNDDDEDVDEDDKDEEAQKQHTNGKNSKGRKCY